MEAKEKVAPKIKAKAKTKVQPLYTILCPNCKTNTLFSEEDYITKTNGAYIRTGFICPKCSRWINFSK